MEYARRLKGLADELALILYRVMCTRLKDSDTNISPERALEHITSK